MSTDDKPLKAFVLFAKSLQGEGMNGRKTARLMRNLSTRQGDPEICNKFFTQYGGKHVQGGAGGLGPGLS